MPRLDAVRAGQDTTAALRKHHRRQRRRRNQRSAAAPPCVGTPAWRSGQDGASSKISPSPGCTAPGHCQARPPCTAAPGRPHEINRGRCPHRSGKRATAGGSLAPDRPSGARDGTVSSLRSDGSREPRGVCEAPRFAGKRPHGSGSPDLPAAPPPGSPADEDHGGRGLSGSPPCGRAMILCCGQIRYFRPDAALRSKPTAARPSLLLRSGWAETGAGGQFPGEEALRLRSLHRAEEDTHAQRPA